MPSVVYSSLRGDRCDGGLVALQPRLVLFRLALHNPVRHQDFRIAEVVIGDFNTGQARQWLALPGSAHERAARDALANNFTISTPFVPVPPVIGSLERFVVRLPFSRRACPVAFNPDCSPICFHVLSPPPRAAQDNETSALCGVLRFPS